MTGAAGRAQEDWLSMQVAIPRSIRGDTSWISQQGACPVLNVPPSMRHGHLQALHLLQDLSDARKGVPADVSAARRSRAVSREGRYGRGLSRGASIPLLTGGDAIMVSPPSPRFAHLAPDCDDVVDNHLEDWFDSKTQRARQRLFSNYRELARECNREPLQQQGPLSPSSVVIDHFGPPSPSTADDDLPAWARRPISPGSFPSNLLPPARSSRTSRISASSTSRLPSLPAERLAARGANQLPDDGRSKYVHGCVLANLMPRASLLIRDARTTELSLSHQGIGDDLGRLLAETLSDMPLLRCLDLNDNRLTDASLEQIIDGVSRHGKLLSLDLSSNDCDTGTSTALGTYLGSEECSLSKLTLQSADVSDEECAMFVRQIQSNPKTELAYLDLSRNIIGLSENRNLVNPDFQTGGEALADWLCTPTCKLKYLDVSWNAIRGDSARALGNALGMNQSLQKLMLSYNGLGEAGGEAVGVGLLTNNSLRKIDLSNNAITPRSAFVLSVCMLRNETLTSCVLDSNPVGVIGGKSLLRLPILVGNRLEVSLTDADLKQRDDQCWFDPDELRAETEYKLDMTNPYERAVAYELLGKAAGTDGASVPVCVHEDPASRQKTPTELIMQEEMINTFCDQRIKGVNLDHITNQKARELFFEYDSDGSHAVDRGELTQIFKALNLPHGSDDLEKVFKKYDLDNSGIFELSEFLDLLDSLRQECKTIRQRRRYMADAATKGEFLPPAKGMLTILYRCEKRDPEPEWSRCTTTTDAQTQRLVAVIRNAADKSTVLELSVGHLKLTFEQAQLLYKEIHRELPDSVAVLAKILPHVASASQAHLLVDMYANSIAQRRYLQLELGPLYTILMGYPSGHYKLRLEKEYYLDRLAMVMLVQQSNTETYARKAVIDGERLYGDTSQHQNWQNFRNETWNGEPIELAGDFWKEDRCSGLLEFDYVSIARPARGIKALSSRRFGQLLICHKSVLIPKTDEAETRRTLDEASEKRESKALHAVHAGLEVRVTAASAEGAPVPSVAEGEPPKTRAPRATLLDARANAADEVKKWEFTAVLGGAANNFFDRETERRRARRKKPAVADIVVSKAAAFAENRSPKEQVDTVFVDANTVASCVRGSKVDAVTAARSASVESLGRLSNKIAMAPGALAKVRALKRLIIKGARAAELARKRELQLGRLQLLLDDVATRWFTSEQAQLLAVALDPAEGLALPINPRVEVLVALHARVVDLYNFGNVARMLPEAERAELVHRLGWLNTWSPLRPDGPVMLDLSQAEERVVAKALALLAEVEKPGERWGGATFQECITQHPIPNWSPIPPAWNREDGLPKKGVLAFEYRADDASAQWEHRIACSTCTLGGWPEEDGDFAARVGRARPSRARADELDAETQFRWTLAPEIGRAAKA